MCVYVPRLSKAFTAFRYEVRITSFLRGNGGAHLKMKSTAKTSYAAAELIFKERDSAILIEFHL